MLYSGSLFSISVRPEKFLHEQSFIKAQIHVLNLLPAQLAQEHNGAILTICQFQTDIALLDPFCQNLEQIFS